MTEKKKTLLYLFLILIIPIISLVYISFRIDSIFAIDSFDIDTAKTRATEYLSKNEKELTGLFDDIIENNKEKGNLLEGVQAASYNDYDYYITEEKDNQKNIRFRLGTQGFLDHGQEYGLIYLFDDGEDNIKIEEEYWNEPATYTRKKIKDHWYYYYFDF